LAEVALTGDVVRAAGVVLWRQPGDAVEVALVHRPKYDDWTLPKGKLDPGEHPLVAAVREAREETGHQARLGRPLLTQHYAVDGRPKEVRYWAAQAADAQFVPTGEIDGLEWLAVSEALERLTYPRDVDLVRTFTPTRTWPLILLRHAEAVPREEWTGPDGDRPLTGEGHAQAARLSALFGAYGIERVVSSDARRCVDTVVPYATEYDRPVLTRPLFSESEYDSEPSAASARALLKAAAPAVLCTHRPVLPGIAAALCEAGGVRPPKNMLAPGSFWVLHIGDDAVLAVEEHAP
jgi:8-oxo-dGTP pyrophosphatase MutT (NUDIX family)/phosphohistidine phosphatase SixA